MCKNSRRSDYPKFSWLFQWKGFFIYSIFYKNKWHANWNTAKSWLNWAEKAGFAKTPVKLWFYKPRCHTLIQSTLLVQLLVIKYAVQLCLVLFPNWRCAGMQKCICAWVWTPHPDKVWNCPTGLDQFCSVHNKACMKV